ncbi:MAG: hypothetical protein QW358_02060 [Candidatus Hadarchaeum sp.]
MPSQSVALDRYFHAVIALYRVDAHIGLFLFYQQSELLFQFKKGFIPTDFDVNIQDNKSAEFQALHSQE